MQRFEFGSYNTGTCSREKRKQSYSKKEGKVLQTMQLTNLQNVTISSDGISISSNAIKACVLNKVSIHFLNFNGIPYAMLYSPQYVEKEIGMAQLNAYNNGKGQKLIKQFVYGKILNQTNLIKYQGKYNLKRNKEFRDNYSGSILKLKSLAKHVLENETFDIEKLRLIMFGYEGQASIIYWKMNALLFKGKMEFEGRIRKKPSDLINNMLNYGYGILYSKIHEAIIKSHLNPHMSYLHKPDSFKPTLVYDLIEEFRSQGVDRVIFAIVRKNTALKLENKQLSDQTKQVIVKKILERMNVVEKFRGHEMRFFEIIQFQTNMMAKFLKGEVNNYRPYIKKW
ncbi:MAG: CRISPR-associated endonuclease Cas1 [Bacteroidales bacterium]